MRADLEPGLDDENGGLTAARQELAREEFLRRRPFELQKRFPREDIAWALDQKGKAE